MGKEQQRKWFVFQLDFPAPSVFSINCHLTAKERILL